MEDRLYCAHCGEVIGVYEPAGVMLRDGTELEGSPLTLGEQLRTLGSVALHAPLLRRVRAWLPAAPRRRGRLSLGALAHRRRKTRGTKLSSRPNGSARAARRPTRQAASASPIAPRSGSALRRPGAVTRADL